LNPSLPWAAGTASDFDHQWTKISSVEEAHPARISQAKQELNFKSIQMLNAVWRLSYRKYPAVHAS
jgi:hypothetical protein